MDGMDVGSDYQWLLPVQYHLILKQSKSSDYSKTKSLVFIFFYLWHYLVSPQFFKPPLLCSVILDFILNSYLCFLKLFLLISMNSPILQIVIAPLKNLPTFMDSNCTVVVTFKSAFWGPNLPQAQHVLVMFQVEAHWHKTLPPLCPELSLGICLSSSQAGAVICWSPWELADPASSYPVLSLSGINGFCPKPSPSTPIPFSFIFILLFI